MSNSIWKNGPKEATHYHKGQYLKVENDSLYYVWLLGYWRRVVIDGRDLADAMERPGISKPTEIKPTGATHRLSNEYFKIGSDISWIWIVNGWAEIQLPERHIKELIKL